MVEVGYLLGSFFSLSSVLSSHHLSEVLTLIVLLEE